MNIDEFLTVKEVATILKVTSITVYEYIRMKKLRAIKIGRYYRIHSSDFEKFLKQQRVK